MRYTQQVKQDVLCLLSEGVKVKHIANATGVKPRTIRDWRMKMDTSTFTRTETSTTEEVQSTSDKYIDDQCVTVRLTAGNKDFTEAEINDFFLHYSTVGYNYTQRQMINHFSLSNTDWGRIKNHFGIMKKANVFADFSFERIPPQDRLKAVEERLATVFKNPNHVIDRAYSNGLQKQLKKQIVDQVRKDEVQKQFNADLVTEFTRVNKPVTVFQIFSEVTTGPKELFIALSDLHINSRVEGLRDATDYNNDIAEQYFADVSKAVACKDAASNVVLLNGDLVESITGKNHPDVFTEMEYNSTYAKGIMKAVHMFANFLGTVNNLTKVIIISGNHDRLTTSNREDANGGAAELIYEFLKLLLPDSEVVWDPKVITHSMESTEIICSHGDKLRNVKPEEIFYRYGSRDKYNVYMTGHWHHLAIKFDGLNGRHISLPAFFSGNTYSDHAGYSSKSGYVLGYEEDTKFIQEIRNL